MDGNRRRAVETTEGPVLVLAGAGSGKTSVLTRRMAYLIDGCGVPPVEVLAITFTNKAAREMAERVKQWVGRAAENLWVGTFHSFCVRFLRREAGVLGFDGNFYRFFILFFSLSCTMTADGQENKEDLDRMTWLQALWFAVVQGITELFPVSSVAHAVLLPAVLRWPVDPEGLLPFTVMLHLGTALALLLFYWRDWLSLVGSLFHHRAPDRRRVLFLLIVATIPAAVIGGLFEKSLRAHFPSAASAAFFLMVNGIILWIGDRQRRRAAARSRVYRFAGREDEQIARLGFGQSFLIGLAQCLALIPGFSRSGMTMIAGLYAGLSYEAAARFAFLLATPIIFGAGILEVPKLLHDQHRDLLGPALLGGAASGIAAFLSVWILTRYFHHREVRAFRPFAIYCLAIGLAALLYFVL